MSLKSNTPLLEKSAHQQRVEQFMRLAKQGLPPKPEIPDLKVRLLRAKLILEEALETIEGLGFTFYPLENEPQALRPSEVNENLFLETRAPLLKEILDGCCDLKVVTTGTLSACGLADEKPQQLVDENNLAKFGPGGYRDKLGKWQKPPNHKPPPLEEEIQRQQNIPIKNPEFPAFVKL